MKTPSGFGGIRKLSGKRRKPYQAVVTIGYEMIDGVSRQKQKSIGTFVTRKEAMQALAEYNNNPLLFDGNSMTFGELYELFEKTLFVRSENTRKQKQMFFNQSESLHNRLLKDISQEELQILVSSKKSHSTQGSFISFFRDMFRYGMSKGYVQRNPAEYLLKTAYKNGDLPNPFSYEEYLKMPKEYDLFFYTGLRADEMLKLTKDNIIEKENLIAVPGTKTDNAMRYIPISPKIMPIIEEKTGKIWTLHNDYFTLLKDVKRISGDVHTTHDMRKTFATALSQMKIEDKIIKKLLGHATNDVTENHYIKTDFSVLRDAIDRLDIAVLDSAS